MPYRRTDNVLRKQAARHRAILAAAEATAKEEGIRAVQIGEVAARAGIAAGTIYRYFPSKTDLVSALAVLVSDREVGSMRKAAAAAPGPLSALAAAIATFAIRALRARILASALLTEAADPEMQPARLAYRNALTGELQARVTAAMQAGYLPAQNAELAARALLGALLEGLLATNPTPHPDRLRDHELVQAITLLCLRALGVMDARARGLVVQIAFPPGPGD